MGQRVFSFEDLSDCPLIVDAIYEGGDKGNVSDDPISKLLPVGNSGGIRKAKKKNSNSIALIVLYTTKTELEWPDELDKETGIFKYYGDNRKPGNEINNTKFGGNKTFEDIFSRTETKEQRFYMPPIFIFEKAPVNNRSRSVKFLGVAVPGSYTAATVEDSLIAIWRYHGNERFQNYEAYFSILNIPKIHRGWIEDIHNGVSNSKYEPNAWSDYIKHGLKADLVLQAETSRTFRSVKQQLPVSERDKKMLEWIYEHYSESRDSQTRFERFSKHLIENWDARFQEIDLTRPWRDGGRDGLGYYVIKHANESLRLPFAFEAKCYKFDNGVGVKEVSRLISRIKYREFGILVTTSYVNKQAYEEVKKDGHPILFISGRDLVDILMFIAL